MCIYIYTYVLFIMFICMRFYIFIFLIHIIILHQTRYHTFRTAALALNQILRPQVGQYLLRHRAHRCPSRSGEQQLWIQWCGGWVILWDPAVYTQLTSWMGGGFNIFSDFHPENQGRWTHFDEHIFPSGLKPPTYLMNGCFIFNGKFKF